MLQARTQARHEVDHLRVRRHLAAVKVIGDAMGLDTVRFARQLVDVSDLAFPKSDTVRPVELAMAEQAIKSVAGPCEPGKYAGD